MYSVMMMAAMTVSAPDSTQWLFHHRCGCGGGYGCSSGWYGGGCGCGGYGYGYGGCGCGGYGYGGYGNYGYGEGCGCSYGACTPQLGYWAGKYVWGNYGADCGCAYVGPGNGGCSHTYAAIVSDDLWPTNRLYTSTDPLVDIEGKPTVRLEAVPMNKVPALKTAATVTADGSARLVIETPVDARVFVDGNEMKSNSEVHQFYTPVLQTGETYFYDVRVEMTRDGKLVAENKRVYVKANDVVRESFNGANTAGAIASK